MTLHVITLIGDADRRPVEPAHIDQVRQTLEISGKDVWLAEHEACDLFFETDEPAAILVTKARAALPGAKLDIVCLPAAGRRKKLLISDMDSTVIDQECIDELADAHGVGVKVREITAATIAGQVGFSASLRQRTAEMKGLDLALLEKVYANRITLMAGARTTVQTMRSHGVVCVLVTGGFDFFAQRVAERIGFHTSLSNTLEWEGGKLTGTVVEPVLGRTAKRDALVRLCAQNSLTPGDVLAVGDGANDIKMIEAAGLGVAFHGADAVKAAANACIDLGNLTALLYIQGYSKSQFATT